jgi:hypothetical protein
MCSRHVNHSRSIVNMIGGGGSLYDHFMSTRILKLTMNKLKKLQGKLLHPRVRFANHLVLIMFVITWEE